MTDVARADARFEQDLRAVLADLAPDAAPGSLRAAMAAVPARRARRGQSRERALLAVMGMAAALVVLVTGLAIVVGQRSGGPAGISPDGVPTAVPSPSPATETLTFRVQTPDGSMATKAQTEAVAAVMDARLRAYGIGTFSSSASDDRLTYEVPLEHADEASIATVRELLTTTGAFSIVLLGSSPVEPGQRVDGPPLLTGSAITDARVGTDAGAGQTLDLTMDAATAAVFADTTRAHVGEYLALVLDGVAVAVPMITEAIPDGRLQISFADNDRTPSNLATILAAGQLPLPVEQVTP